MSQTKNSTTESRLAEAIADAKRRGVAGRVGLTYDWDEVVFACENGAHHSGFKPVNVHVPADRPMWVRRWEKNEVTA